MSLAAIFSRGYAGYASASDGTGAPGIFFYSGSISGSESDYDGIGIELAHAAASMRFATVDNSFRIANPSGTVLDAAAATVDAQNSARQLYTYQPIVQITGSTHEPVGSAFITHLLPSEQLIVVVGRLRHYRTGSGSTIGKLRCRFRGADSGIGAYTNWNDTAGEDYSATPLVTDYAGDNALYFRKGFSVSNSFNAFDYTNQFAEIQIEIAPTGSNATCSISDLMVFATGLQSAIFLASGSQL